MTEITEFIIENKQEIIILIGIVLILLVIINIKGINLNEPKPESKLIQEVTVETFSLMEKEIEPSCSEIFTRNFSKL